MQENMSFVIDWRIFAFALLGMALFYFLFSRKSNQKSSLLFPSLQILTSRGTGIRASLHYLPKILNMTALSFFLLALLDPHYDKFLEDTDNLYSRSTQGTAIYFVLDRSGSMNKKILHSESKDKVSFGTKLDVLKQVTDKFIDRRPSDLIGLVAFARGAQVMAPLTLDHDSISRELQNLEVVKTPDQDGTAIGYAIFKTASVLEATKYYAGKADDDFNPAYDIKGSAIILVTDGFQSPHPNDKGKRLRTMGIEEAAEYAKSLNARLYIISIDPAINSTEYTPQRNLLRRAAELTGGQFYSSEDAGELDSIYTQIDDIERSIVPTPDIELIKSQLKLRAFSYFQYLITFGIIALTLSIFLETLYFRRVP